MKKIFTFILSIGAINTIQTILVIHQGTWVFKTKTLQELDGRTDNIPGFFYRFMRNIDEQNDFEIIYFTFDDTGEFIGNGTTRFCQADTSTFAGTTSAVAARALGIDVVDGTPCPIESGIHTFQWHNFTMDGVNVEGLDDLFYIELVMAVHSEDWGIDCFLFSDENGVIYLDSLNESN